MSSRYFKVIKLFYLLYFGTMSNTRSRGVAVQDLASQFSANSRRKPKLTHSDTSKNASSSSEEPQAETDEKPQTLASTTNKEIKKPPKRRGLVKIKNEVGEGSSDVKHPKWMPENWKTVVDNIREMRKSVVAPVDTMGCDTSHELNLDPKVRRYHILVSLMLSSQTKDQTNYEAMSKLRAHGLSVENILATDEETFGKMIYPVSFWPTKAKNIKKVTQIIRERYNDDIPDTIEKLCELPGVGPKMAHLAMDHAWGVVTGIGVDTHVHRISNRLGWTRVETKMPEGTRKELEDWLPRELWSEVNHLLVGFGQTICRPVNPLCDQCLNKEICPYAKSSDRKASKKSPGKKK